MDSHNPGALKIRLNSTILHRAPPKVVVAYPVGKELPIALLKDSATILYAGDPIDSSIQSRVNRGDGFLVILRTPRKLPLSSADRPSSDADRANLQVTLS